MAENAYKDIERASGDVANTHEYMFDINTGTAAAPVWLNVPEITALNPAFAPKLKDIATYADMGASSQKKVGSDFTLDFNILKIRDLTGEYQDYWLALKEAADADGDANNLGFRYYDALGASDAYQGIAAVSRGTRPSTANDDPAWDNFSLAGKGPVRPIANPLKSGAGA